MVYDSVWEIIFKLYDILVLVYLFCKVLILKLIDEVIKNFFFSVSNKCLVVFFRNDNF